MKYQVIKVYGEITVISGEGIKEKVLQIYIKMTTYKD